MDTAMAPSSKSEMVIGTARELATERHEAYLAAIPEALDDDGFGMVMDILNASDKSQLIGEPELPSAKDLAEDKNLAGHVFRIPGTDIVRRKSTLIDDDGTEREGWYLIVPAIDKNTGTLVRFNTSAGTVLAKLVKIAGENWFPCDVTFTLADKTKSGFRPVNMNVLAFG